MYKVTRLNFFLISITLYYMIFRLKVNTSIKFLSKILPVEHYALYFNVLKESEILRKLANSEKGKKAFNRQR